MRKHFYFPPWLVIASICGCDGAPGIEPRADAQVELPDGRIVPAPRSDSAIPFPDPIDAGPLADSCGLEDPAFCETFETPHPGGRGGEIDETRFSFERWHHAYQYMWFRGPADTYNEGHPAPWSPATFCGEEFSGILPPNDVRSCAGIGWDGVSSRQLNEVFDDHSDFGIMSMRIRQPFDFTGRTGRVVWDVDAKFNPFHGGHGWWTEMWITEDPAPIPYHEAPTIFSVPRRGIGIALRFSANNCERNETVWENAVDTVFVSDNYEIVHAFDDIGWDTPEDRCFRTSDARMNHFELRIDQDRLELWVSDFDDPSSFRRRVVVDNLDLSFTRGYVHFQHAHYNAAKDGMEGCEEGAPNTCPTPVQTFRWDNIGFDGPRYPLPRGYDVANNDEEGPEGGRYFGYFIDDGAAHTFEVHDVDLGDALGATLNFGTLASWGSLLQWRLNGGAWHDFVVPGYVGEEGGGGYRGFSIPVSLEELRAGDNTIEFRMAEPNELDSIGNIDITVDASR